MPEIFEVIRNGAAATEDGRGSADAGLVVADGKDHGDGEPSRLTTNGADEC